MKWIKDIFDNYVRKMFCFYYLFMKLFLLQSKTQDLTIDLKRVYIIIHIQKLQGKNYKN